MLFTTITIKYERYKVHIVKGKKQPSYEIKLRKDIKYIVKKKKELFVSQLVFQFFHALNIFSFIYFGNLFSHALHLVSKLLSQMRQILNQVNLLFVPCRLNRNNIKQNYIKSYMI
jgi:hypothetical protein